MRDLREEVRATVVAALWNQPDTLSDEAVDSIVDQVTTIFLGRVAKALSAVREILEPENPGAATLEELANSCTPWTLMAYCDRLYPEEARRLLMAHAGSWMRDRDELTLRGGG